MVDEPQYIELKEIKCPNCGGEIHFEPSMQLSVCIHCGSKFQVIAPRDIREIAPDLITPFHATKEQIRKAFLSWLIEGNYTPDDILIKHVSNNIDGIYIPFYLFNNISFRVNWTASSGYDRQETYVEHVTKYREESYQEWDSISKTRVTKYRSIPYQEAENRTRTVTDWRPSSGQVSGNYPNSELYCASIRFVKHKAFLDSKKITADSFKTFNIGYITGFALEPFSLKEKDVYEIEIKKKLNKHIDKRVEKDIPGDHQRDISWNGDIYGISPKKCYYPYWLINYSYNEEKHNVLIDGQMINRIEGTKPVDNERKKKMFQYFYPLVLFIVFLIAIFFILQDKQSIDRVKISFMYSGFFTGAVLLIMGFYRRHKLLSHSMATRKEMLNNIIENSAANNASVAEHSSPSLLRILSEGAIGILLVILVGVFSYFFASEPPAVQSPSDISSESNKPPDTQTTSKPAIEKTEKQQPINAVSEPPAVQSPSNASSDSNNPPDTQTTNKLEAEKTEKQQPINDSNENVKP